MIQRALGGVVEFFGVGGFVGGVGSVSGGLGVGLIMMYLLESNLGAITLRYQT